LPAKVQTLKNHFNHLEFELYLKFEL